MKKYLLYIILLVAFFIGISATASYAAETGNLTVKIKPQENYAVYSNTQRIGLTVKLSKNGQPLEGTYQLEETNVKSPTGNISFSSEGEARIIKTLVDPDPVSPYFDYFSTEASIVIKDIPVGTTYQIIPDADNNKDSNSTTYISYYTTDNETGDISDGNNIVNYILKPKLANFKVNYLDLNPDYDAPDLVVLLNLYSRSMIPPSMYYYISSNPDEIIEMTKKSNTDFTTGKVSLKEGESIIVIDAPVGIQYYTSPDSMPTNYNYCYTGEPQSGIIWGSEGLDYNYWNTVGGNPTNLAIIKIPSGKCVDMTKEFTFKLTGSAYQQDGSYKKLNSTYLYNVLDLLSGELIETKETTFTDGVAYVNCKANQKIEIGDVKDFKPTICNVDRLETIDIDFANKLYSLTKFEIEEVDCDEYKLPWTGSAKISSLPANIYIPNTRKFTGNLTIKKEITDDVPEDEEFTFKIKLTDGATDLPTEYEFTGSKEGTLQFEDGIATITLKGGESITISGLPLKCTYEVQEEGDNYKITKENATGKVEEETIVTITNSKKEEPQEETEELDDPKEPVKQDEKQDDTKGEEKQEEQGKQEEQENGKDNVQEEKNEEIEKNEENIEEVKEENKEEQTISENPKTFDNINIIALITLCSLLAFICITKIKKSK